MAKKVLISPSFGAGWVTWNSECGKALAEDLQLIALVEAGKHRGTTPYTGEVLGGNDEERKRMREFMVHKCSPEFFARACAVGRANGCAEDWAPYCGGVEGLIVVEVDGPYRIDEYDGSESLKLAADEEWW